MPQMFPMNWTLFSTTLILVLLMPMESNMESYNTPPEAIKMTQLAWMW